MTLLNKQRLQQYYADPFGFFDNLNLSLHGNNLNIFQKYVRLRKTAFVVALTSLIAWVVFGFDSTPLQFVYALMATPNALIPNLLFHGKISAWSTLMTIYNSAYGKEMHYSAFVVYGLAYWFLSRHFDQMEIKKSRNVAYTCALVFLSIALFEFYWIYSYAYFQNQWWVATWRMPQLRILLQNVMFLVVGCIGALYVWVDSFILKGKEVVGRKWRFNWNWKALLLLGLSLYVAMVWINWPFGGVQHITVQTTVGTWVNSAHFPQSLYTVDVDPTDPINAGVWFYVQNDFVHAWNTLVKIIWTLTLVYVARLRKT